MQRRDFSRSEKPLASSKDPSKILELQEKRGMDTFDHVRRATRIHFNPQSEEILFKRGLTVTKVALRLPNLLDQVSYQLGFSRLQNDPLSAFCDDRFYGACVQDKNHPVLRKYSTSMYREDTVI